AEDGIRDLTVTGVQTCALPILTLLFAAMLGINRLFVADAEEGALDGFLLAPVDRTALLAAKVLALLAYLVVLELVAVPAFALLRSEERRVGKECSAGGWAGY